MYEYGGRVRLSETDEDQKMTLSAVLNHFQDCSTFQSEDLGVGIETLKKRKRMWVLNSWRIEVCRYPRLGEHITVGTWPYDFGRLTGNRGFCMLDREGALLAKADTVWVFMDTERMRPTCLDQDIKGAYTLEPGPDMGISEGRIAFPEEPKRWESFRVQGYHLDVNHHVNNVQYVQMAAAYLPRDFEPLRMRAEYKRSAVEGDVICPQVGKCEDGWTVVLGNDMGKTFAAIEFKA